jgi:hypothetical protein
MDVIGHHDKPDTLGRLMAELFVQHSEDNPLRMVVVEEATAAIARKRDEVSIQGVITNTSARHDFIIVGRRRAGQSLSGSERSDGRRETTERQLDTRLGTVAN